MIKIKLDQLQMSTGGKQNFLKHSSSKTQDFIHQGKCPTQSNLMNLNNNGGWMKQQIIRLQKQAKAEKQKRQEIETKYQSFKERLVHRQQEFYKILQKLNVAKQYPTKNDVYIQQIYQKILCTFDDFNEKARELLDDRYSEIYRLMERRVDILMQKMDKQLGKYRKTSIQERKEILQSIREITTIAAQTENQNIAFRKINSQLTLKVQMLNDEKKLMLEEIVTLKAQISKLIQKQKCSKTKSYLKNDETFCFDHLESTKIEMMKTQQFNSARVSTAKGKERYDEKAIMSHARGFSTMKTIDFGRTGGSSITNQQNTINHLKQCLLRQKNKNLQLIRFSLQLQSKQQKIKQLVGNQIINDLSVSSRQSLLEQVGTKSNRHVRLVFQQKASKQLTHKQNCFNTELLDMNNNNVSQLQEGQAQDNIDKKQNLQVQQRQQVDQQNSKLQQFITEINKIFHLPQQSSNSQNKPLNTYQPKQTLKQSKKQNRYQRSKKGQVQVDTNTPTTCRRRLSVRKQPQTSRLTNRSIILNKSTSHQKQNKNGLLFTQFPQLLIIQGGSIDIK